MSSQQMPTFCVGLIAKTFVFLVLTWSLGSCRRPTPASSTVASTEVPKSHGFCAAIRGNGNFIFTHFGALSRIVEDYGELDAIAGGSSASVTAFLYESILKNPLIGGKDISERRQRIALLIKSLMAHFDNYPEFTQLVAVVKSVEFSSWIQDNQEVLMMQPAMVAKAVLTPAEDEQTRQIANQITGKITEIATSRMTTIINPVAVAMLKNMDDDLPDRQKAQYANYAFKVNEVIKAAQVPFTFEANSQEVFFREGIIDYAAFAKIMGGVANFYAGVDPKTQAMLGRFLDACEGGSKNLGKTWDEIRKTQVGNEKSGDKLEAKAETCGSLMHAALRQYWQRWEKESLDIPPAEDRLQQNLGETMPAYVPSAYLAGSKAVGDFDDNLKKYRRMETVKLNVNFEDVKFGYFVPVAKNEKAAKNLWENKVRQLFPQDAKAKKISILNDEAVKWETVLKYSPLEPGLGRTVRVSDELAYIGGWADLHPVQILRAAGCDKVIYVTRRGAETSFVTLQRPLEGVGDGDRRGIAELLNMTSEQQKDLYLSDNPNSSFNTALKSADAVWCTDWDRSSPADVSFMFNHSYGTVASPSVPDTPGQPHRPEQDSWATKVAVNVSSKHSGLFSPGVAKVTTPTLGCSAP